MTKIVLPKVLQNFKLPLLAHRTEPKNFPRNIQYRTRQKGSPPSFFGIVRLFSEIFSPKGPTSFFWSFATEWMLKNPKGLHFFGIVRLFQKNNWGAVQENTFTL